MIEDEKANPSVPPSYHREKPFIIRALAFTIDTFSIFILHWVADLVLTVPIVFGIGFLAAKSRLNLKLATNLVGIPAYLELVLPLVYFTVFEWQFNSTLGKSLFKLRVLNLDGKGCSLWQAFIRGVFRYIDFIPFGLTAYLNMVPPLYQRWGDKLAGTYVVSTKDPIFKGLHSKQKLIVVTILYLFFDGLFHSIIFLLLNLTIIH